MINSKRTVKTLITLILIVTMASSIWIGTTSAMMTGQSTVSPNANYVTFEGTASTDQISSQQYSYMINEWAMSNVIRNVTGVGNPAGAPTGVTQGPTTPLGYVSPYAAWGNTSTFQLNPGDVWFNAGKSLRIGMTEFGEFADQGNTGIAYGANVAEWNNTESWASTAINQAYMVQGWQLYLNYSRFYVPRCLEAYALYSNTASPESARAVYSWDATYVWGTTPGTTVTAGHLVTAGIQVLYDSAMLGVARETTTIWDGFYNEPVAQVTVTAIYDKTTKDVIVYYDVKMVLDPKVLISIYDFVFSKKYEIDLARNVNPSNAAYIHYYCNFTSSIYQDPLVGTYNYDVIQAYDPAHQYIFFDGIYPSATEYSVANALVPTLTAGSGIVVTSILTKTLNPGTQVPDIPLPIGEPNTPVVTIQWNYTQTAYPLLTDFLTKAPNREIRFIDVYGMTDYNHDPNPAVDNQDTAPPVAPALVGYNEVDTEVQWLLNNVFNPNDLTSLQTSESLNYVGKAIAPQQDLYAPSLWVGVGQGSAATDSAGAASVSPMWGQQQAPLGLFDINDTTHQGTIPYGLSVQPPGNANDGVSGYIQTFSNKGLAVGNDPTSYWRLGLINFAFGTYDNATTTSPQPVTGGYSSLIAIPPGDGDDYWWYPAKSPLTERWSWDSGAPDKGWGQSLLAGSNGIGTLRLVSEYNTNNGYAVSWNPNGIIMVGGEKANYLTRYFNDLGFAIDREGTTLSALVQFGTVTGTAPTNNAALPTIDFFPVSSWNTSAWNPVTLMSVPVLGGWYGAGTAIISIAVDNNGTRGISVAGWNAQDTYWASAWVSQWLTHNDNVWVPAGTVAIILKMTYASPNSEPTFNIVEDLGTITQFGTNYFVKQYLNGGLINFDNGMTAIYWYSTYFSTNYDYSLNNAPWFPASGAAGYPGPYTGPTSPEPWWYAKLPTTSSANIEYDS